MSSALISPMAKKTMSESADPASINGSVTSKWSRTQTLLVVPPGHVTFRFLCHSSRISGIIGRSNSVIKQLQSEMASKIKIEDSLLGSDDRMIFIVASSSVSERLRMGESKFVVSDAQDELVRVFEKRT